MIYKSKKYILALLCLSLTFPTIGSESLPYLQYRLQPNENPSVVLQKLKLGDVFGDKGLLSAFYQVNPNLNEEKAKSLQIGETINLPFKSLTDRPDHYYVQNGYLYLVSDSTPFIAKNTQQENNSQQINRSLASVPTEMNQALADGLQKIQNTLLELEQKKLNLKTTQTNSPWLHQLSLGVSIFSLKIIDSLGKNATIESGISPTGKWKSSLQNGKNSWSAQVEIQSVRYVNAQSTSIFTDNKLYSNFSLGWDRNYNSSQLGLVFGLKDTPLVRGTANSTLLVDSFKQNYISGHYNFRLYKTSKYSLNSQLSVNYFLPVDAGSIEFKSSIEPHVGFIIRGLSEEKQNYFGALDFSYRKDSPSIYDQTAYGMSFLLGYEF